MAAVLIIYGLFFSPLLKIKTIEVEESSLQPEDIAEAIKNQRLFFGLIPSDNILLIKPSWISRLQTPDIKNFYIKKKFLKRTVLVRFEARKEILSWCFPAPLGGQPPAADSPETISEKAEQKTGWQWQCFYSDPEGFLFKKSSFIESPYFIKIKDSTGKRADIGDFIDFQIINFSQKIFLASQKKDLAISQFEINNYETEEIIGVAESFKILFNLKNNPEEQINNLFALLSNEIKDNRDKLLYIDLRNNNKIFYKLR